MKPILEWEFHNDGRGPEECLIWGRAVPKGFEFLNPEDDFADASLKHLRLIKISAFAFAGEEVHGEIVHTAGSMAAIYDLGKSSWLQTINQRHLENCSHFQSRFFDEIFDVVCWGIEAGIGTHADDEARE